MVCRCIFKVNIKNVIGPMWWHTPVVTAPLEAETRRRRAGLRLAWGVGGMVSEGKEAGLQLQPRARGLASPGSHMSPALELAA